MIYVSRSKIKTPRAFVEESQVEAALARLGFVTVRPESMTLDEQIVTFSRARVVVGPHGSGLANAGFAPPGCLIVEILPSLMARAQLLPAIARHLGHRVIVLVAKQELLADQSMHKPTPSSFLLGRYSIKPELVVDRVLAVMKRLGIARA
jgi:capsular polysaccharide biosynthesis protein